MNPPISVVQYGSPDSSKFKPAGICLAKLSQFDSIASAEAVGANQVLLTTKRPYPVLLAQLVKLSIVPRAVVEKLGNDGFNQHPIGSGPYRLISFARGVKEWTAEDAAA